MGRMPQRLASILLLGLLVCTARGALADAIVVSQAMRAETICEIRVEEGLVRSELEIGVGVVRAFANLLPNEVLEPMGIEAGPLDERLPRFFAEDWVLEADGEPLPGRVREVVPRTRVRRDIITGEPLPVADGEEETVLFFVFEHAFEGRPKTLTLRTWQGEGPAGRRGQVGFVTWHLGVPAMDFLYLPPEVVLDLDWADPWFSRFRARNLKRRYDAPLSVFLYVDAFEVRKEVIARPKDLQHWVDLGLEGATTIPVEGQGALKEKVAAFLAEHGELTIDGVPVTPVLDRVHFIRRTLRTTGVIDPPEELPIDSAQLGIIYSAPIASLPQRASLTWDLWSPRIQKVPSVATDEAGGMPTLLTPEDPTLVWQNFLKNPTVPTFADVPPPSDPARIPVLSVAAGLALIGLLLARRRTPALLGGVLALLVVGLFVPVSIGGVPQPVQGAELMQGLLGNVYRAFDFRSESDIYDALARSVDGDMLTETYLETKRALVLENQGGARARVQGVEVQAIDMWGLDDGEGFAATCTWAVAGSVGHWGHIHQRRNRYTAEFTVRSVDGVWKITGLELLDEERL